MMQRLVRMIMGVALAIVFAGQTALASDLCGRTAHPVAAGAHDASHTAPLSAPPCHETGMASASSRHGDGHTPPAPVDADHDGCECAAAPTSCLAAQPVLASAGVQLWTWIAPGAVRFVSAHLTPDGPPPKA